MACMNPGGAGALPRDWAGGTAGTQMTAGASRCLGLGAGRGGSDVQVGLKVGASWAGM